MVATGEALPFAPAGYSVTVLLPKFVTTILPFALMVILIGVFNWVLEPAIVARGATFPLASTRYAVKLFAPLLTVYSLGFDESAPIPAGRKPDAAGS